MSAFIHGNNTSDIRLVAALGAMGINCDQSSGSGTGALQTRSGVVRTWNLGEVSNCGKWRLSSLSAWWHERDFHVANPANPFNAVKAAMASSKAMADAFTRHLGITTARRGNSLIAQTSDQPVIVAKNPVFTVTDNLEKIAAFMAVGFEVTEIAPNGSNRLFQIPTVSINGEQSSKFEIAWNDVRYHETNPQQVFAYVKAALWNHRYLVGAIKADKPLIDISRGESFAYLHPDCSAETERKILSQFNS